jgi:putative salt-induced outer membrane protein YdiY
MIKACLGVFIAALVLFSQAFGDQVTLKNGDRISGTIIKADSETLMMSTDFAGDVTVQWAAVTAIQSTQPLHVAVKGGQTVSGTVTTKDGGLSVETRRFGPVTMPKDNVLLIRNDAEQASYEQSLHPSWRENWEGGVNIGFALTRGNSQTKNLALAFTADRKTLNDKLGAYAHSVYATNDSPGALPNTTANFIQGGIRYDHDLTPRLFGFAGADFQTDDLQNLDLRSVLGAGLGYHAIKAAASSLDLLAGLNYTHESYSTFSRNFPAATLGEEFTHKLRSTTVLVQKLYFYPDLSATGEYRATFDLGTVTKMSKWLGWQNSFGDIYVTNPPAGKKQNDIIFTTGLSVSFARPSESAR